ETARCGLLVWLSRSCHNSRIKGAGYIEHVARSSRKPGRHEASLGRRVDMTARRNTASIAAAIAIVALAGTAKAEGWDKAKAEAECAKFTTYGMAEDGVYGPWFKAMYAHYGWKSCNRTDNDLGSSEVVAAYEAEKNNPQGVIADIGIVFGPEAAKRGLALQYTPAGSDFVPAAYRQAGGGWIGSVGGAIGFTVNLEAI